MDDPGRLRLDIQLLRERMTQFGAATLRISESLDFETVLQGVVDSARVLTDSKYGVLTTLDESERPQDFVTSGMSAADRQAMEDYLPEGLRVYQYLSSLREPLRVSDYSEYVSSIGLSDLLPFPVSSFLAAPLRHGGEAVGNIYLAKQGPDQDFTQEDEETLVLFASQAALVISNARRHREERRARSDMETLIDTCPVGVAVFNARTGEPTSFNQEAVRIVSGLLEPGQALEELLRVVTVQRADGSEVSLEDHSMAQALSAGETLRAEQVVIRVPDGRSVTTLMNATPIRSPEGEIESFVITFQDMTPLEELERQRAEFLGMVSHELRTPLSSIKGSAATLKESANSLDPAEMDLFFDIIEQQANNMSGLITDLLDMARIDTGTLPVSPDPADPAVLVDQARNDFLSGGGRNNVHIDVEPELPLVMADRRRIVQVLDNLLSNAARHSPESSPIHVAVSSEGVHVQFSVTDRGDGLSPDLLLQLFRKFSRMDGGEQGQNNLGGSGMGLAICKGIVEAHGGRIWAESDGPGLGARFAFTLPEVAEAERVSPARPAGRTPRSRRGGRDRARVLVVDDDPQTLRYVRDVLSDAGYDPVVTGDPEQVASLMEKDKPHLVLLDMMLPGTDGIVLMETVPELSEVPVIFLSAYGRDQVIARALQAGAADYVVKPFSPTELVARVQTALRRRTSPGWAGPAEPYVLDDLTVNYSERRVYLAGRAVQLTDIEYRLLFELSANAGRVLTHADLLQRVWGPAHTGHSGLVRTVVKNLRRKLGDDADNPTYIITERWVGYRMAKAEGLEEGP